MKWPHRRFWWFQKVKELKWCCRRYTWRENGTRKSNKIGTPFTKSVTYLAGLHSRLHFQLVPLHRPWWKHIALAMKVIACILNSLLSTGKCSQEKEPWFLNFSPWGISLHLLLYRQFLYLLQGHQLSLQNLSISQGQWFHSESTRTHRFSIRRSHTISQYIQDKLPLGLQDFQIDET